MFVLNGVDGCIPSDLGTGSDEEIDEERRLLYVAMTRAKEDLHIVTPQRFYVHNQTHLGDCHVWAQRTRFIPQQLMGQFEAAAWPPVIQPAARDAFIRDAGAKMFRNQPAKRVKPSYGSSMNSSGRSERMYSITCCASCFWIEPKWMPSRSRQRNSPSFSRALEPTLFSTAIFVSYTR